MQLTPPAGKRLTSAQMVHLHTAGAEVNVAIALAQLGHRVAFISRLGDDPFGERILQELIQAGVDVSMISREMSRPTGVYFKDHGGTRTGMYYYREGSAATMIGPQDVAPALAGPKLIHATGITAALGHDCAALLDQLVHAAPGSGSSVSFDVNYRSALWSREQAGPVLLRLARCSQIVFVGCDEAAVLWGTKNADDIRELMPQVSRLVVKDSAAPAHSFTSGATVIVPALPVRVVEAVGAGDAFAAGYLSAVLRGMDERIALRWAHLLAATTVLTVADHAAPPTHEMLVAAAHLDDEAWARGDLLDRS